MPRRSILISCAGMAACASLARVPMARGATAYTATVLYPLQVPAGSASISPRSVMTNHSAGSGLLAGANAPSHALLWSSPTGAASDLNPTNLGDISSSRIMAAVGDQQVGSIGGNATGGFSHAALWSGAADSAVDLEPTNLSGFFASGGSGSDGVHQVGFGFYGTQASSIHHALLWTGTADSAVDLNPVKFDANVASLAFGVGGGQQVGEWFSNVNTIHATLWTGSADSAVDLHPADPTLAYSLAIATNGAQQVGAARASGADEQAFLWFGTADSAVNLNPLTLPGINASEAVATNGQQQVGFGFDGSVNSDDDHALVWSGSADSAVDLHGALPASGTWNFSDADGIDPTGNIFGTANGTYNGFTGDVAVEWSPATLPEPGSSIMLGIGMIYSLRRHRRRR